MYARDEKNPDDRTAWRTQHDALKFIDPPYVYHVVSDIYQVWPTVLRYQHEKREAELGAAVQAILKNPIGRYIRGSRCHQP